MLGDRLLADAGLAAGGGVGAGAAGFSGDSAVGAAGLAGAGAGDAVVGVGRDVSSGNPGAFTERLFEAESGTDDDIAYGPDVTSSSRKKTDLY